MAAHIINLFAGPGSGKSTMAASLFAELKKLGVNAELVTEYAKDCVWEGRLYTLTNQIYIFGKQLHRLFRVVDKVDVVVTDSPILFSIIYAPNYSANFSNLVKEVFANFKNINLFVRRSSKYNPIGRTQTEEEAVALDSKIEDLLKECNQPFRNVDKFINTTDLAQQLVSELNLPTN